MSEEAREVTPQPCPRCGVEVYVYPAKVGSHLHEISADGEWRAHSSLVCERTRELFDLRARLVVSTHRVPDSVRERISRRGWFVAFASGPPWNWLPSFQGSRRGFGWSLTWLWWGLYFVPKSIGEVHARFLCHQWLDRNGNAGGMLADDL